MSTTLHQPTAGVEPIAGYTLRRKLGSGGYGEVWLADAPGGLQKAVKFVYGTLDQDRASSELRSLQRILQVHHPFILSIERIEVIDQHLLIVTELAECSLYDQFSEFRKKGHKGIPRTQLLRYMRDTADALDYLSTRHELQHLDIKPGNLLVVADRVKVADFGLVKDLQDKNISLISGLTPTYAAPEMFDGRPGRHSDQYSLAVVYQELLTGDLPFHGQTMAQLATQHLLHAPDLEGLPETDRLTVSRALAKDPAHRFPSCSEFIEQLMAPTPVANPTRGKTARKLGAGSTNYPPKQATISAQIGNLTSPATTAVVARREVVDLPPSPEPENAGWLRAPTLFVGLGGTGNQVMRYVRYLLDQANVPSSFMHWLLLDSDANGLREMEGIPSSPFTPVESILLPLKNSGHYREQPPELFETISRRWLYNVPRSLQTEGVRPLGQLALIDNQRELGEHLRKIIGNLKQSCLDRAPVQENGAPEDVVARIYVACSAHGGTGSAWLSDIGFAIRNLCEELEVPAYQLIGIVASGTVTSDVREPLPCASALSLMTELTNYFRGTVEYDGLDDSAFSPRDNSQGPVDFVYLINGKGAKKSGSWHNAVEQASAFIANDAATSVGLLMDEFRNQTIQSPDAMNPWLRAVSAHVLPSPPIHEIALMARTALSESLSNWSHWLQSPQATTQGPGRKSEKAAVIPTNDQRRDQVYLTELQQALDSLLPTLQLTPEQWVPACSTRFGSVSPQLISTTSPQVTEFVNQISSQVINNCWNASSSSSAPAKLAAGLVTGVQLQIHRLENALRQHSDRLRKQVELLSKQAPQSKPAPANSGISGAQADRELAQLKKEIDRYLLTAEVCLLVRQAIEPTIKHWRKRLHRVIDCWNDWPNLIGGEKQTGKQTTTTTTTATGPLSALRTFHGQLRNYVNALLQKLVTEYVLDAEGKSPAGAEVRVAQDRVVADKLPTILRSVEQAASQLARQLGLERLIRPGKETALVARVISERIADCNPEAAELGGERRLIGAVPFKESLELFAGSYRMEESQHLSVVSTPIVNSYLFCELQQIKVSDLSRAFWGASPELQNLAERMHVRANQEWEPLWQPPKAHPLNPQG